MPTTGAAPAEGDAGLERDVGVDGDAGAAADVSVGTVGVDAHLKVGKALYTVPWRLIGQRLHARTAGDIVQIFADGQVVATHVRRLSGRSTDLDCRSHRRHDELRSRLPTLLHQHRPANLR